MGNKNSIAGVAPEIFNNAPVMERPLNSWETQPMNSPESVVVPKGQTVPVADIAKGTDFLAKGQSVLEEANRERATVLDSAKAAVSTWIPAEALEAYHAPTFPHEVGFSAQSRMADLPFTVDADTRNWFNKNVHSNAEFDFHSNAFQERNKLAQQMADHSVVAGMVGMLDPSQLALDVASGGIGLAVGGGIGLTARAVAGGFAAAGGYAGSRVAELSRPVSTEEAVLMTLMNGAGTATFLKGGKVVPRDPEFPSAQLTQAVQDAHAGSTGRVLPESDPAFVGPAKVHAPDNLTVSRVPATGEGRTPVTYSGGENPLVHDYNPEINLSRGEQSALTKDGRVIQVQSVADIAQHAKSVELGRTVIEPDAKAVYLPAEDRVFLIRDNIKPTDDIKGIMLHEYGVHMNAERVLGTETLGKMLSSLEDMALSGNTRAKQAFADVPKDTPLHLVREEALGYYVERNHGNIKDSIISRMVAGVRSALRKSGMSGLRLTENDIMQLVRKAAKGGEKASKQSFDAAFPYAWHGSAVRGIDALDTKFMGTGEGRQGFGFGHYLSSEKGTALDYRNKESIRRGINPEDGGLYRAKINATHDQFLHLEGREQSPVVQAALDKLGVRPGVTGKSAYDYIARKLGGVKQASEALHAEGVAGNRYSTGRTRNADVKSSNYVLFHNDSVDLAARYSKGTATQTQAKQAVSQALAKNISWSLHKTLSAYGDVAKRIANVLVDDPLEMSGNSVVNQHRAIRADLAAFQYAYEDKLAGQMASLGYGLFKRIVKPREAMQVQIGLEREVYMELLRRNRLSLDGATIDHVGVKPYVKEMADAVDKANAAGLAELKKAGVTGADAIAEHSGYISRRWDVSKIEGIEGKLVAGGMADDAARAAVHDAVSIGMQRANGWDSSLAGDVAKAVIDNARRKGYFEDTVLRRSTGADGLAELRDMLTGSGIPAVRMQRVLDVMAGKVDEAGKAPILKHRVDVAMDESIRMPDGTHATVADMLDTNVAAITDRYLDKVSTQAALAKKGLVTPSDVTKLRQELAHSIPDIAKRGEAMKLFDNTMAAMRGDPVGEDLPAMMRNMQAVTQMVSLAWSGMWQLTEYASAMAIYGGLHTFGSAAKELPGLRGMLSDPIEAGHLRNVLARNSSEDLRIRPFINKMEDNFEIPVSQAMQMALMQAKQLVPYANAMKFIQNHQARTVGNLVVNTFERAANGDAKAAEVLGRYGLESHTMIGVRADIAAHGMDTVKWSKGTWDAVRAPLTKMMDDAVLKNRTGEIPAFAQFSATGKFLFTFRSFVLGAHNKVLAGTLHREGFGGIGLLMAYQMPLTMVATAAHNTMQGKKPLTDKQLAGDAFGQMSALGLFGEIAGVTLGTKQQFGSPGTMGIDRAYKLLNAASNGNGAATGAAALNMIPILSVVPPLKALGANLQGN